MFFYLLAIVAVCVWGGVVLRYGGLVGACLALMVLACCFGYDFYVVRVGPLPMTSDRVAIGALCVVYALCRLHGRLTPPRLDRWDIMFAAFLVFLTGNTLMHNWRSNGAQPLANLIFLYLYPAAVYWIVRGAKLDAVQLRRVHITWGLFSLYLAVTAIAEVRQLSFLVYPRYILTSPFQEWLGRARGPFLNPATNGMYLAAGLFAWALYVPRANRPWKIALLGAMGLTSIGVACTLTRSCWLGAGLGLAMIVFVLASRHWRLPLVAAGVLLAAGMLIVKGDSFTQFKRDRNVSSYEMAQSARLRPMLAVVAGKIARDYPLFGCGFGQYPAIHGAYLHDPNIDMPLETVRKYVQHNVVFSLLAETGLVGATLYLILLGGWVYRGWCVWRNHQLPYELRRHGLLTVAFFADWFVIGMFQDTNLMVNGNLLVFMMVGLSQGIYASNLETANTAPGVNQVGLPDRSLAASGRLADGRTSQELPEWAGKSGA